MIEINTKHGIMQARVFIERGERALGIVIEQDGVLMGCLRIDDLHINEALRTMRDWLPPFQLLRGEGRKLGKLLCEEHKTLRRIRREGISPAIGWLGGESRRTLPDSDGFCALA